MKDKQYTNFDANEMKHTFIIIVLFFEYKSKPINPNRNLKPQISKKMLLCHIFTQINKKTANIEDMQKKIRSTY